MGCVPASVKSMIDNLLCPKPNWKSFCWKNLLPDPSVPRCINVLVISSKINSEDKPVKSTPSQQISGDVFSITIDELPTTDVVDVTTETVIATPLVVLQNRNLSFGSFEKDSKSLKIDVFENNSNNKSTLNIKTEFNEPHSIKKISYFENDEALNNEELDEGELGDIIVDDDCEVFINNEGELIIKTSNEDGNYTINDNGELEVEF